MTQINDDSVRKTVAFAGLLHDIGKFLQRAEVDLNPESKQIEGYLCPKDKERGHFTHRHVLWTDHFFREKDVENLLTEVIGQPTWPDNATTLAAYHHKPSSKLQELIQEADCISAMEREEGDATGREEYKKRRLSSVFATIALERTSETEGKFKYPLVPLSLSREVFPKEGLPEENLVPEYEELQQHFLTDLKAMIPQVLETANKFDFLFNSFYYLLQKYTWCIPSYTHTRCDISLFDHLRTTSAIALCLYDYQFSEKQGQKEFLLVEGDISGVQKFIYRVSQPTGVKHIARIFRGRSFYLTLLPMILARYIVSRLELTIAHILWCGGGKFDLLLPNTKEAHEKLKVAETEIQNWFFDKFEAELALALGKIEASKDELKDFGTLLNQLSTKVEEEKQKKFIDKLERMEKPPSKDICRVCNLGEAEGEEKICRKCEEEKQIGEHLPKAKYLAIAKSMLPEVESLEIPFGNFGIAYLIEEEAKLKEFKKSGQVSEIIAINNPKFPLGFIFIGTAVAKATKDIEGTEVEKGHILPFEHLAKMAEGDERLGILKMDIDHLGFIFSFGLPKEKRSISRIATMSRMLDWFFGGYVNTIAQEVFNQWKQKATVQNKEWAEGCLYTVYSGGDDLLIVGPWSEILEFTNKLHREFKDFTCQNLDIDLSAGVFLCKPKFPISRASVLATDALSEAKGKGKKRISVLGDIVTWQEDNSCPGFYQLTELAEYLTNALNSGNLPRRFLHRLLELRERYAKETLDLNYIPALVYLIIRAISDEELKQKLWEYFISGTKAQDYFQNSLIPASIALLKTRRGG